MSLHITSLLLQLQVLKEELLDGGYIVVSVKLDNKSNKISFLLRTCRL